MKYIIKASNAAMEFIERNNLAQIICKLKLLNNVCIIESKYDEEVFNDIIGVEHVRKDREGSFCN